MPFKISGVRAVGTARKKSLKSSILPPSPFPFWRSLEAKRCVSCLLGLPVFVNRMSSCSPANVNHQFGKVAWALARMPPEWVAVSAIWKLPELWTVFNPLLANPKNLHDITKCFINSKTVRILSDNMHIFEKLKAGPPWGYFSHLWS